MPDLISPKRLLSHGFYRVTVKEARKLNGGKLPKVGMESLVDVNGKWHWLALTPYMGTQVWSIRDSGGWVYDSGKMTLKILDRLTVGMEG